MVLQENRRHMKLLSIPVDKYIVLVTIVCLLLLPSPPITDGKRQEEKNSDQKWCSFRFSSPKLPGLEKRYRQKKKKEKEWRDRAAASLLFKQRPKGHLVIWKEGGERACDQVFLKISVRLWIDGIRNICSSNLIILVRLCGRRKCLLFQGYLIKGLFNAKGDNKKRKKP